MQPAELHDALLELAREAGLRVERLPATRDGDATTRSGVCRLRGELRVLLAPGDGIEDRIAALVAGLRTLGPAPLEARWLPPAVRRRLEGGPGDAGA
jgi:hypothetical protein